MKTCTKCKIEKDLRYFFKNSREFKNPRKNKDGMGTICKTCLPPNPKKGLDSYKQMVKERRKRWELRNTELRKKIQTRFRQSSKGIHLSLKKRGNCEISQSDFIFWHKHQAKLCHYCKITEENARLVTKNPLNNRLNIDRYDNNLGYCNGNLVLACGECNRIKGSILTGVEMEFVGKQVMLPRWKLLLKEIKNI